MRTITFKITPWRDLSVSRTILCLASHTLHDLHRAIQRAFELDDDHLYAFYLNNNAFDPTFQFTGPGSNDGLPCTCDTVLGDLPLKPNKRFLYLFDFGDELRHEVKVEAMGEGELTGDQPQIVASHGVAPPQYGPGDDDDDVCEDEPDDEESCHEEDEPPDNPGLVELVPRVKKFLAAHLKRIRAWEASPGAEQLDPKALAQERDLALLLLERSGGNLMAIHEHVEHAVQANVVGWLMELPLKLATAGMASEGLDLLNRLSALEEDYSLTMARPLILAAAGHGEEARAAVERNRVEFPDDPRALIPMAKALVMLGDEAGAEALYREALAWVGDDERTRITIVQALTSIFRKAGRTQDLTNLVHDEKEAEKKLRQQRARAMGLPLGMGTPAEPVRREGPKVGANEPCPCGSGKKYKKCCGKVA